MAHPLNSDAYLTPYKLQCSSFGLRCLINTIRYLLGSSSEYVVTNVPKPVKQFSRRENKLFTSSE